jgi:hypothetical protein
MRSVNKKYIFVIPMRPRNRLMPWKKGEEEATARGINDRKHRETADTLWLAKQNRQMPLEEAETKFAPPSQNPLYQLAMKNIRSYQGRSMRAVLLTTECGSLKRYAECQPGDYYTLQFIVEELVEKGWTSHLEFERLGTLKGQIVLVSDFRLSSYSPDF